MNLVVLESFNEFLAGLQQRYASSWVLEVLELHRGPGRVELLEHLLHAHLLHRLVHDVLHLVLELVQVEGQKVGESRLVVQHELHLHNPDRQPHLKQGTK